MADVSYVRRLQYQTENTVWKVADRIQFERRESKHPKKDDLDDILREAKEEFAKRPEEYR